MKSGDICPNCKRGVIGIVSSQSRGDFQARYLRCSCCNHRGKSVVRSEEIRRRNICPK